MALSLDVLQESWDKSNLIYGGYRGDIDRLLFSKESKKVEAADGLTGDAYRKLAALEQQRRQQFGDYYAKRGIKCYPVEAIHVGNVGGTEFTEPELGRLARSLSFVQLNINHVNDGRLNLPDKKALAYPSNQTNVLRYDELLQGIFGLIQVEDSETNAMICSGKINSVSIEYLSLGGRDGAGIVGTGLALVTSDAKAADKKTRIYGGLQYDG